MQIKLYSNVRANEAVCFGVSVIKDIPVVNGRIIAGVRVQANMAYIRMSKSKLKNKTKQTNTGQNN